MYDPEDFKIFGLSDDTAEIFGTALIDELIRALPKRGPEIDVFKTKNELIIIVNASGVQSPEQINISLAGYILKINGEIPRYYPAAEAELLQCERFSGPFNREIQLPPEVVPGCGAEASYKNGLIIIHIPLVQDERTVSINFEDKKP